MQRAVPHQSVPLKRTGRVEAYRTHSIADSSSAWSAALLREAAFVGWGGRLDHIG